MLSVVASSSVESGVMLAFVEQDSSTTSGLTFGYKGGKIRNDNKIVNMTAGTVDMVANTTNYLYADPTRISAPYIFANQTGYPQGKIPLYTVTTNGTDIVGTPIDDRTHLALSGAAGSSTGNKIAAGAEGKPNPGAKVLMFVADSAYNFPTNLSGSQIAFNTNPAGTYILTVYKNGVSQGTITITSTGVVTVSTNTFSLATGDRLWVQAPAVQDASLSDLFINLVTG